MYRRKTLDYLEEGHRVQAYRALRDGKAFGDATINAVARKQRHAGPGPGAWCVAKGAIYMPKSTRRERMVENADVFDLAAALGADDFSQLSLARRRAPSRRTRPYELASSATLP